MSAEVYCFDTSALVAAWDERYPIDIFPWLWRGIAHQIVMETLILPDEVETELEKKSKEVSAWLRDAGPGIIATDNAIFAEAQSIIASHPRLVMERKRSYAADPFVIALARVRRATVVTEEGRGSISKPKIPDVCADRRVRCISLLEFIRAENWMMKL